MVHTHKIWWTIVKGRVKRYALMPKPNQAIMRRGPLRLDCYSAWRPDRDRVIYRDTETSKEKCSDASLTLLFGIICPNLISFYFSLCFISGWPATMIYSITPKCRTSLMPPTWKGITCLMISLNVILYCESENFLIYVIYTVLLFPSSWYVP